jgi:hypothetical protein
MLPIQPKVDFVRRGSVQVSEEPQPQKIEVVAKQEIILRDCEQGQNITDTFFRYLDRTINCVQFKCSGTLTLIIKPADGKITIDIHLDQFTVYSNEDKEKYDAIVTRLGQGCDVFKPFLDESFTLSVTIVSKLLN